MSRLRIVVYRTHLLPISETFVLDHCRSIPDCDVVLAGVRPLERSIDLCDIRTMTAFPDRPAAIPLARFLAAPRRSHLFERISAFQPDLIHAHFAVDAVQALPIAAALGVPLAVTLHGYDVTSRMRSHLGSKSPHRWNYLLRRSALLKAATCFLPVSDHLRETALSRGYPASRTMLHRLGVDLERLQTTESGLDAPATDVLFVGRLVPKKGAAHLLDALAILASEGRDPVARIIGDGPLRDELKARCKRLGLKVAFLGARPHREVLAHLRRAKLLCMPSVQAPDGDEEGLPIVALEAQACGVPVVAFRRGGVLEAVLDGTTALLAENGDVRDLARRIGDVLTDDDRRAVLGRNGQRFVEDQFSLEGQSKRLRALYDRLIERPMPRDGAVP